MKSLNEPLARLANNEDDCKGRFWEARFKSQALLDEVSVLKCMAYVDLNPIRANVAKTPETSDHTSIQARIEGRDCALAPLSSQSSASFAIPISKEHYLNLVDWTGRHLRPDKRGSIQPNLPPILDRLPQSPNHWKDELSNLTRRYARAIGDPASMLNYRDWLGQSLLNGVTTV